MANTITITNPTGTPLTNYPVRIGRPFVEGEIVTAPGAFIASDYIPTQSNVKTRWPGGSVRHAVIYFVLASLAGSASVTVTFAEQPAGSDPGNVKRSGTLVVGAPGAPTRFVTIGAAGGGARPQDTVNTRAGILAAFPTFDAELTITQPSTTVSSASARDMLADTTNVPFTTTEDGSIATHAVLADHSVARTYDMGDTWRPIRPIYHVTFWHGTGDVHIRVLAENSCTESLFDAEYAIAITKGTTPTTVYTNAHIFHYIGMRWTKKFWLGTAPATVKTDHNRAYLVSTKEIPNFDPTLTVPGSQITSLYNTFVAAGSDIGDTAGYAKDMGSAGGADYIGLVSGRVSVLLYTWDTRMVEDVEGLAHCAMSWQIQMREGNGARSYLTGGAAGSALGKPVSVYARPNMTLPISSPANADQPTVRLPRIDTGDPLYPYTDGWRFNQPHLPDPYAVPYLIWGEYYYLEQLQLWAAGAALTSSSATRGGGMAIDSEARGMAWVFRSRVSAAVLSPDGSPEKTYFTQGIHEALATWEGKANITGSSYQGNAFWNFGNNVARRYVHPLHFLKDNAPASGTSLDPAVTGRIASLWQHNFLISEFAVTKERGFPEAIPLLEYCGYVLLSQFAEDFATYPWYLCSSYWTCCQYKVGGFVPTWPATYAVYTNPKDTQAEFVTGSGQDGYHIYAHGAASFLRSHYGAGGLAQTAYDWLYTNAYLVEKTEVAKIPKWGILPR